MKTHWRCVNIVYRPCYPVDRVKKMCATIRPLGPISNSDQQDNFVKILLLDPLSFAVTLKIFVHYEHK